MTEKTGLEVIRNCVKTRVRQQKYGPIARDIAVHGEDLVAFGKGRKDLPPHKLHRLVKELFNGHAVLGEDGMLRSSNKVPPRTLPGPEFFPKHVPNAHPVVLGGQLPGPQPVKPAPPVVKAPRAGLAE